MCEERALLFVKLPQPGRVKTRLAAAVGRERAAALYDAMVRDALEALDASGVPLTVCRAPTAGTGEYGDWLGRRRAFLEQRGADLGERMLNAFEDAFALGAERVVLVGGDLPGLAPEAVRAALDAVAQTGAALAPSGDGGYSLVGFTHAGFAPEVFRGIPWGTDRVLDLTLETFARLGRSVRLLPHIPDVDVVEDLAALAECPDRAPRARRTLALAADLRASG